MKSIRAWVVVSFMFGCLGVAEVARGDLITTLNASVTPQVGGAFLYSYTLSNSSQSDLSVVELDLNVSPNANLQALTGPTGWGITYTAGNTVVSWQSPGTSTDILPGSSGNFSFTSKLAPGSAAFTITGLNETTSMTATNTGQIASPGGATVPEPSSLVLSALGASGVLMLLARSRRRPPTS